MQLFEARDLKHILCMGAHADDIEIGCGGTLRHLISRNPEIRVTWIVFSATGPRVTEAKESAQNWLIGEGYQTPRGDIGDESAGTAVVRQHDVRVEDFPDGRFPAAWAELKDYFRLLSGAMDGDGGPDLIFTHRLHDRHQDHRIIAELTWQSFRDHCILECEIPKYEGDLGHPNVYVPLAEDIVSAKCRRLWEGFPSQTHRHWFDEETFRSLMRIRGLEAGGRTRYAEAFEVRKLVVH